MDLSSSGLFAYARTEDARKKLRYAGVSLVFIPLGQGLIQVFGAWLNDYTAASLLATAILIFPSFFANKKFVFRVSSRQTLHSQVLVFWVVVMLGFSLATLLTYLVENAMADRTMLVRGAAVFIAQVLGLSIVWVGRFLILDRWLFKLSGDTPEYVKSANGFEPTPNGQGVRVRNWSWPRRPAETVAGSGVGSPYAPLPSRPTPQVGSQVRNGGRPNNQ